MVGTPPSDSVLPSKGMGLLARLGFCRRPFSDDEAENTVAPKPVIRSIQPEPHIRVRIKVQLHLCVSSAHSSFVLCDATACAIALPHLRALPSAYARGSTYLTLQLCAASVCLIGY